MGYKPEILTFIASIVLAFNWLGKKLSSVKEKAILVKVLFAAEFNIYMKKIKVFIIEALFGLWKRRIYYSYIGGVSIVSAKMHTIDPALSSEITPHITYFIRYFGDTRKSADQSKTNLSFNISAFLDFMVRHHTAEADRNKISSIEIIWYDRTESNFYATRVMFEKSASGGAVTHKYVTDGETLRDVMFKRIVFKKKYAKNLCGR